MNPKVTCSTCGSPLTGRQRRFCSRRCKNADTNHRHQSYLSQQSRGWRRKIGLLEQYGGACSRCGYARNLAALVWHHVDPGLKSFSLDLRSLSNRSESEIRSEVGKCIVLCANCHAEVHHPQFNVFSPDRTKKPA
jgi:endogenous inhibitor of DNA gyrase (YacG/DUF329 family)